MRKQAIVAMLLAAGCVGIPSAAHGQTPAPTPTPQPGAEKFEKITLNDFPGEPMNLAVLPDGRVLHTARTGEIRIHLPEDGRQRHRGEDGRLSARRGRAAERRDQPADVRQGQVGLRVLLAAAEHAGRQPGDAGLQRGRRAGQRHRGGLGEVQGRDPAVALQAQGQPGRPEDRAEDHGCAGRSWPVLPRRRQHRVRPRGQPVPVHGRRLEPVLLGRLHADGRVAGPQPGLRRPPQRGQHERPARQDPADQAEDEQARLHDPEGQPVRQEPGEDEARDLRDGPAQPVPVRHRPGVG